MNDRIIYIHKDFGPQKRKKGISRILLAWVLFLAFYYGGVLYAVRNPSWQIAGIEIRGLERLDENKLRENVNGFLGASLFAGIFKKGSFFLFDEGALISSLKSDFPRIDSIRIQKIFPDKIELDVRERKMWAIFCVKENITCVYLDKNGFGYEKAPQISGSLIRVIKSDFEKADIPGEVLSQHLVGKMIQIAEELDRELGQTVTGFEISNELPREIKVGVSGGYTLQVNQEDDFLSVFKILKTVLDKEIKDKRSRLEYVDLRFGNKVFYKFRY